MADRQQSITQQVHELIITHPKDVFISRDISEQMDEESRSAVTSALSRPMMFSRVIEKTGRVITDKDTPNQRGRGYHEYRILNRDPNLKLRHKLSKEEAAEIRGQISRDKPVAKSGLTMEQIGEAMVAHINDLKSRISRLSGKAESHNSELRKERDYARQLERKLTECQSENRQLREKLRSAKGTFPLNELIGR